MITVMSLTTIRRRYKCLQYGVNYSGNLHSLARARREKIYMHFVILGSAPDLLFYMYGTCSRLDILNINNYKILYIYLAEN
jgi:hypothetical protein